MPRSIDFYPNDILKAIGCIEEYVEGADEKILGDDKLRLGGFQTEQFAD